MRDPNGLSLALVASPKAAALPGWSNGDVPSQHAIRGFNGISLWVEDPAPTGEILTQVFGFARERGEGDTQRFTSDRAALGTIVDLKTASGSSRGRLGPGTLHHVAFRAASDADQAEMTERARRLGLTPTEQKDRQYFRSVYFREPNGVLFEIATDDPGFTRDEPKETLGTALKLPPWYENRRSEIEKALPPLT
jgi:glyoxalase family protein